MWKIILYVLLGGLFTSLAHIDVRMIVVPVEGGEKLYLDNYTAHTTFLSWFKHEAYSRVRGGISYGLCHMETDPDLTLNRMSAIKYGLLQLFQALSSGDHPYSRFLLDITSKHNKTNPETLFFWLESNFKFPLNDIYSAVKNFIFICMDNKCNNNHNIKRLMIIMSERYSLFDKAVFDDDMSTVKWLTEYSESNMSPHSIQLLWSGGRYEILNRLISDIKTENETFSLRLFSKIYSNETFLEFAVDNGHMKLVDALLESNKTNHCLILSKALEDEKWDVSALLEKGPELTNLSCTGSSSVRLLHSSLAAGRVDIAKAVVDSGTHVDSVDGIGLSPLYIALTSENTETLQFLLAYGAKYNSTIPSGRTLLSLAIERNRTDLVIKLLSMGASPLVPDSDGQTSFHLAIKNDNVDIFKIITKDIKNINETTIDGHPILHYVVENGSNEITRVLLEYGSNVDIFNENGTTPLMLASKLNDTMKILLLAEFDSKINSKDKSGCTALHHAVKMNSFSSIKVLIILGANVNAINNHGHSPLYIAVEDNNIQVIPFLVQKGADINLKMENGDSLLHVAANHNSIEAFELLLNYKLQLNITNNENESPLNVAVKSNHPQMISLIASKGGNVFERTRFGNNLLHVAVEHENVEAMVALLKLRVDQNEMNVNGSSALTNAILKNNFVLLKDMLTNAKTLFFDSQFLILASSKGCLNSLEAMQFIWSLYRLDIHKPDWRTGWTPLTEAVKADQSEVVNYLKEMGADIFYKSNNDDTLLHLAAINGSINVLKILLHWNLTVDCYNKRSETPLWLATKHGHLDAMMLLKDNGANLKVRSTSEPWEEGSLFLPAAFSGSQESVLWLISNQLDLEEADLLGSTALLVASQYGHEGIVMTLLDEGASVDQKDIVGETSLHKAIHNGHTNLTKTLIDYGAELNSQTVLKLTPLHVAASKGDFEIVRTLLANGAEKNVQDKSGWTPLHYAAYYGHSIVVKKLLNDSVNATIQDNNAHSPLDLASERKHVGIVTVINNFYDMNKILY